MPETENETKKPSKRRWPRVVLAIVLTLGIGLILAVMFVRHQIRASLPQLEGEATIAGLTHPVTVDRDAHGVPVVAGQDTDDLFRAQGFLHAQERFFQMDLNRRKAAGELAELFGEVALPLDRALRPYRLRDCAQAVLERISPEHRQWLHSYVDGVNAGLDALGRRPPEYLLIGESPTP